MTESLDGKPADKRMKLRYAGVCRLCGTDLPVHADAVYEPSTKTVRCVDCPSAAEVAGVVPKIGTEPTAVEPTPEPDTGVAGSSRGIYTSLSDRPDRATRRPALALSGWAVCALPGGGSGGMGQ